MAHSIPMQSLSREFTSFKNRRHSSKLGSLKDQNPLEVCVQTLDEPAVDQAEGYNSSSEKKFTRSQTLLISPSGQCCPVVENEEESMQQLDFNLQQRVIESDIGNLTIKRFLKLKRKRKDKIIHANEDVLSNYHDSYLYGKVVPTIKVRAAIRGGKWSPLLMWVESFAALILIALYVRSTYTSEFHHSIKVLRITCASFFVVDYLVKLYSAPVRLYYIVSFAGIIDLISALPFLIIWSRWKQDDAIPQLILVLRFLRIFPPLASIVFARNTIGQQIFLLTVYTFGAVFIMAGLLHWVEQKATPLHIKRENNCGSHGCLTFYHAFYFIIVTISTVGYGDITMNSDWGRAVTLLTILIALFILPVQINKIMELASRRPYGGKFAVQKVVGSRFIIISGNLSYRTVQDFLSEFYHPSHDKDMPAFPLRVVVMAPYKPSFEMKTLLAHYKGRVEFIEGTPLNEFDLDRVSAKMASAVFLMADRQAVNADAEDAAQFVRTLSVHRHCGTGVRVIVEMLKPENQNSAILDDVGDEIEIVCPEAIRFQLLARSCHIKGLPTFLTNLFKSGLVVSSSTIGSEHWVQQYAAGRKQEVFPVILPSCFHTEELLFEEAAEIVYRKLHVILFGLDILIDDTREIVLYPKGHQILSSDIGLVIAEDLWAAEEVSKFGHQASFLSCSEKKDSIQDRELLEEIKTRRFLQNTKSMDPIAADFSMSYDDGSNKSSSGSSRPLMRSRYRSKHQSHIQQIISASHDDGQSHRESHFHKNTSSAALHQTLSLEEAIDVATSWPPQQKWEKPDPSVLERRVDAIMENLCTRTISVIDLNAPHILLCIQGKWPINIFYFISRLRMPYLPNPPVVILHPKEPVVAEWGCVGMFEDVYFVKGSPLYELDLVRAGVMQAERVIILAQRSYEEEAKDESDQSSITEAFFDINNILIAATIERLLRPTRDRLIVELQKEAAIHYLRPKFHMNNKMFESGIYARNRASDYMFSPPYIEGKGFSPAALNFLMYATFFNRNAVDIVEKFLSVEVNRAGQQGHTTQSFHMSIPIHNLLRYWWQEI
ncbi:hypothetical protein SUGI_0064550 [Cryptomeria japonica]|nr:hypothetical protein SUGI_0064550 [Cryptomeria japonica]